MSLNGAVGIVNANRLRIDDAVAAGPNMRSTISGFARKLALGVVRYATVDFQTKETVVPLVSSGIDQPLSARQLELKPEGQRAWDWRMIQATTDLALNVNDVVERYSMGKTTRYVVMRLWDFATNGFYQYEIVNAYVAKTAE